MSNTRKSLSVKDKLKAAKRPRRGLRINVRGDLVAEYDLLDEEAGRLRESTRPGAARLTDAGSRISAVLGRMDEITAEMEEYWLNISLEAQEPKLWRAWKAQNPPRDDNADDELVRQNYDALIEFARTCIVELDGEAGTFDDEDWDRLKEMAAPADLKELGGVAFILHQNSVEIPKSRNASALRATSGDDSMQAPRLA